MLNVTEALVYSYLFELGPPKRLAEIQDYLGLNRSSGRQAISRALRRLEELSIISTEKRHTNRSKPMIPSTITLLRQPADLLASWEEDPARAIIRALAEAPSNG